MAGLCRHPTIIDANYELELLLLNQCIEKWQLVIPGEDPESGIRNPLDSRFHGNDAAFNP